MHAIAMTAPQTKNMHECAFTSCTLLTSREFSLHHLVDLRQVLELPCPVPGIIKPSTPPASGAIGTALAKLSALLLHERFLRSGSRKAPDCASQPTGLSCQLTGPHHNSPPDCRNHSFSLRGCANSIHFPQLSVATARHRDTQVESHVAMDGAHQGTFNLCPTTPPGHHHST
eukprot:CAMPEP_0183566992 /NCGR_PEP_ID=MMETSP0371-20130417/113224_1 /TAXON_ID=268820 /ORGANISM="Peridinium aciculiferum, Strain PAER-2" /LENGTH=171 /DNA_ID=CAMNT_0025776325 /DNA_START=189 /DNA_END=700 /DNA_ORIENTATION=+